MNIPNPKLRYALGISALTAMSLAMVGCGGSSSSAPAATNSAPYGVTISGANFAVTAHSTLYNLSATDAEGDAITYTTTSGALGAVIATGSSVLTFTPTVVAPASAPAIISVVATDSKGAASAAKTIAVVVTANQAPHFTSAPPTSGLAGLPFTYTPITTLDPEGDTITMTSAKSVGGGTFTTGANGVFTYTPVSADIATPPTFTVTANDGHGGVTLQTFTVTIGARAPIFLTVPTITSMTLNHPYGYVNNGPATPYAWQVRNLDGNNTIVSATGLPPGLVLSNGPTTIDSLGKVFTGTISGTALASGSYLVTLTATDTVSGTTVIQQFNMSVQQDQKPTQVGNLPLFGVQATQFHDPANLREKLIYQDTSGLAVAEYRFMRSKMNGASTWNAQQNMKPDDGNSALGYDSMFSWPLPGTFASFVPDTTNYLDTYLGTQGLGWRYRALAPDQQDRDGVYYFIKPNSVNVNGAPFTVAGHAIPTPLAGVFPANTETTTIRPTIIPGVFPGGIINSGSPWALNLVAATEYPTINSSTGEITWNPNTSAQWAFTVVAQQMVNGVPTVGQNTEIQVNVPVYQNSAPWIGTLTLTGGTTTVNGVILGGGTSTSASTLGLPAAQEPIANTTSQSIAIAGDTNNEYYTPNPVPSIWRWGVKPPGSTTTINYIGDPDTTIIGNTGHMDAWEMRVSGFAGGMLSLAGLTDTNVPAVSGGQNVFQSVQRTTTATAPNVLDSLYFNPWLLANASNFQLNWGPDREQYLVARFSGMSASNFNGYIQDQYGAYSVQKPIASFNILFGDVRITDSRYRFMYDMGLNGYTNRGDFHTSNMLNTDFLFMYLPLVGTGATTENTIGANLFNGGNNPNTISGVNPVLRQYAQSGQFGAPVANAFGAATPGSASASNWITLPHAGVANPLWTGGTAPLPLTSIGYPANDINGDGSFKGAHAVATIDGTVSGSTTYRQLSNTSAPVADGAAISTMPNSFGFTGWGASSYSDNEMMASIIPHNSPYLAQIRPTGYEAGMNLNPWFQDPAYDPAMNQATYFNTVPAWFWAPLNTTALNVTEPGTQNIWYYGLLHSEVDYAKVVTGRPVTPPVVAAANNGQGNFSAANTSRIRFNFSWPSNITAANMGVSSGANTFAESDMMQIAIPNQASNGRYFFTGNAATPTGYLGADNAYFSGAPGGATPGLSTAGTDTNAYGGATFGPLGASSLVRFPIHALTNSIFIPYQLRNGAAGFPNSVTFTAGTTYTDLPLTGIKGIVSANWYMTGNIPTVDSSAVLRDSTFLPAAAPAPMAPWVNPAYISTAQGDRMFALWMRPDKTDNTASAYATWGATALMPGSANIGGGLTTAPIFSMTNTAPALTDTNTELHFASSVLPGTNQAGNFNLDPILSGMNFDQFYLLATQVGHPTRTRVVFPGVTAATPTGAEISYPTWLTTGVSDGIPFASTVLYAVRDHLALGSGNFGEQGIEPNAPILATWEPFGRGEALTPTIPVIPTILANFYSPFADGSMDTAEPYKAYQHVLEFKMNFLSAVGEPGNAKISRQLATVAQAAPISPAGVVHVVDPTTNNPSWTPDQVGNTTVALNFDSPILTPVRQVKLNDYVINNTSLNGRVARVYDMVNGDATNTFSMLNLGLGAIPADNAGVNKDSNLTLTWKQGQGDQVLPSGYTVKLYEVAPTGDTGFPAKLMATYYVGHTFNNPASNVQTLNLPSINSLMGIVQGAANPHAYYFVIRSNWSMQKDANGWTRVDNDKRPFAQGIPYAYADYVTGTFIAQ